jgi:hypothetical protein
MTDILQSRLSASPDAADSAVAGETVILHLKSGKYFGLDPVGTRIWALIKDGVMPDAVCEQIAAEFDADLQIVEGDTRRFLAELEANDIVVRAE